MFTNVPLTVPCFWLFSILHLCWFHWFVVSENMLPHCILCWCCLKLFQYYVLKSHFRFKIQTYFFAAWKGTLQWFFKLVRSDMPGHHLSFLQIPFAYWALKDKDVKEDHLLTKSLTFFLPFSLLAERTTFLFPLTSFSHASVGKIIRLPIALPSSTFLAY